MVPLCVWVHSQISRQSHAGYAYVPPPKKKLFVLNLEGYLGDIWRKFGGHLEEFWRKFAGKLGEIRRKLGGKNLIFKILIFNILVFKTPLQKFQGLNFLFKGGVYH